MHALNNLTLRYWYELRIIFYYNNLLRGHTHHTPEYGLIFVQVVLLETLYSYRFKLAAQIHSPPYKDTKYICMIMFVKQEQNTLVIIQYIACGGEPEYQTKFQELKNLIKCQWP